MADDEVRLSPGAPGAAEIAWRAWAPQAFRDAKELDRPILLALGTVWCQQCHDMDETTYSAASLVTLINEELVPVRVDADRLPHVRDRYIAAGWPTTAFLTPTGEVLWAGTFVGVAEFRQVARGVLGAWESRRDDLRVEVERRRKAMDAAKSRRSSMGLVRREAADDILLSLEQSFDARNGGWGEAPKFPRPDCVELALVHAERSENGEAWRTMAQRSLDGVIAGELRDTADGGFYRYTLAEDWTRPRYEKLLEAQAACAFMFALGAHLEGREDWKDAVASTIDWVDATLARADGLWNGSQYADDAYFQEDAAGRASREAPPVDETVYTHACASWARTLAVAGSRLGRPEWIERAERGVDALLETMSAPDDFVFHWKADGGEPQLPGLLEDTVEMIRACIAVAQAAGRTDLIARARRLADAMEKRLWADDGGFLDHLPTTEPLGALRYRDRPFELNAAAARAFIDLALCTGERTYRAIAERTLALLSPLAGRYGPDGAGFALAVAEFFDEPPALVVLGGGAGADALRAAALALPRAARRVWSFPEAGRYGRFQLKADGKPVAYACGPGRCSDPVRQPGGLGAALESVL